jgi:hypothetical protein
MTRSVANKNVAIDDKRQEVVVADGSRRMPMFTVIAKIDLIAMYLGALGARAKKVSR